MSGFDPFFGGEAAPEPPAAETAITEPAEEGELLHRRSRSVEALVPWVPARDRPPLDMTQIRIVRACHFKAKPEKKRGCARCGKNKGDMDHITLESFNVFGSGANPHAWQSKKDRWEKAIAGELEHSSLPLGLGGVVVEGRVCFPTRASRDQGNFRVLLEKAVGDCLQDRGYIENDDWDRYEFGNLTKTYERGEHWVELVFMPRWPDAE